MSKAIIHAPKWNNEGVPLSRFLLVWATSAAINLTIIGGMAVLFYFIDSATARPPEKQMEAKEKNEVEEVEKQADLTSTVIGTDSAQDLQYLVERVDEVSVAGMVDADAPVGTLEAPAAVPVNVPPPPGAGGGGGGAILDPSLSGGGAMAAVGGLGGIYNPGGFGGRSGATRKKLAAEGGGSTESEAAVGRGLRFLALHQAPDGHWSLHQFNRYARTAPLRSPAQIAAFKARIRETLKREATPDEIGVIRPDNCMPQTNRNNDTAGTAFGLLPFLAAGITNKPPKEKVLDEKGQEVDYHYGVKLAIDWMIRHQVKSGEQRGYYGGDQYSHGLATIAMCEAYGLTSDPVIKASAQMAINYIVLAQDPAGGGWRYSPRTAGDTSVTGWMLMALQSGQMAGLTVPKATLTKVTAYLNSCESSDKGGYGYLPNSGESPAMTAVGALCRQYLGATPLSPSLLASVKKIKNSPPSTPNVYYIYYATQVMHHMGGKDWDYWNAGPDGKDGIREVLISRQDKGAGGRSGQTGSFSGDDHVGGRLGATSLCLLSLEVYYRHLPLYKRFEALK